ncbi:hypothetical protein NDN08_006828 [Rhodosorus marinus]|uniref:fructose-bisphosphatase n=1 Tax=Rhodosorus marinus TaxID=101924 RepID=A0AAV8UMW1_9RHOD|nr:hypothetical protein NDN08_006828 [Rhodosorus marinus]
MSTSSDELTSLEKFSRQRMRSSFIDKEDLIDGRNPKHDEKPMVGETVVTYLLRTNRHLLNLLEDNVQYSETKNERDSLHDLVALLASITLAIKQVGAMVRRMGLPFAESNNPEELSKLANETWITCLLFSRTCCMLVSEDLEEPVAIEDEMQGQYAVVFDPLTGLADPPCEDRGAIFGIFRQLTRGPPRMDDVIQPGKQLIAAGYALYGAATTLMFSIGDGLHGFTLDPSLNEFILTHENIKVPYTGHQYSVNEGRTVLYDERTREMLQALKSQPSLDGKKRQLRYVGSLVADVHRTIMYGGVYMYPQNKNNPMGAIKLLYEAAPIAFLVANGGGQALTGLDPILELVPTSIHDRVPVFFGSEDDTNFCTGFYRASKPIDDPMFTLRRTASILEYSHKAVLDDDEVEEDGILCAHLPQVG